MLRNLLIAGSVFPALVIVWALVDRLSRRFALKHPELGPRAQIGGCGACAGGEGDGERSACGIPRR